MAGRKRRNVTLNDIDRWIRQGYGSGERESYLPWLRIQDVPSRGVSKLVPGTTVKRGHHLLSKLEFLLFLYFDFSHHVIDIREQYPLLPLAETLSAADQLSIHHPVYPGTTTPVVLTIDFLLTLKKSTGDTRFLSVEGKYKSEFECAGRRASLKCKRLFEKLELKRHWCKARNIEFFVATEDLIPPSLNFNLRVLNQVASPLAPFRVNANKAVFLGVLANLPWEGVPLEELLSTVASQTGHTTRQALELFKHYVWHHWIEIDLYTKLDLRAPLPILRVADGDSARNGFYQQLSRELAA